MREILIISGKGGTGKTSLTAAFAHAADRPVICDLDVDAPDLHLLLQPRYEQTETFVSGHEAVIDAETCEQCGLCADMCRFDAIVQRDGEYAVDPIRCEGCKVCVQFCPANAIAFPESECGLWHISTCRFGPMVHAQLHPGAENSGRLVTLLKQQARQLAEKQGLDLILCDGAPGVGCPVISSLAGTDLAVLVTEPTPSGLHDLKRIAELCKHFKTPAGVIVNKSDLNPDVTAAIKEWSEESGLTYLAEFPFDPDFPRAQVEGKVITEFGETALGALIKQTWTAIESLSRVSSRAA